ncbi:DinB family protein [Geodermatophilus sp. SYSU D00758]
MTAVQEQGAAAAEALARQQARVDVLVSAAVAGDGWTARLSAADRARLVGRGHFPAYAAELDWTPREVTGHLRDSALVFTERIYRVRREERPVLPDFVTDAPERLAGYRATAPVELVEQLRTAQAALFDAVAGTAPAELTRAGVHEVDGPVTLADLLAFLPAHQRDHAEQLAALVVR